MSITRPNSDQIAIKSSKTGEWTLDEYIEAMEFGNQTVPTLLAKLFNVTTGEPYFEVTELNASNALASATLAGAAEAKAAEWAEKAEDSAISGYPGQFSARHWAAKSAASAALAATFAPSNYVPLTGATMTGNLTLPKLAVGFANPAWFNPTQGYSLYDEADGAAENATRFARRWMIWNTKPITGTNDVTATFEAYVGASYEVGFGFSCSQLGATPGSSIWCYGGALHIWADGQPIRLNSSSSSSYYGLVIGAGSADSRNGLQINPANAGATPELLPQGSDTNIDLKLTPKGTGRVVTDSELRARRFGTAEFDAGTSGTSKTIDFSNGQNQRLALTGNVNITLSNPVAGLTAKLRIVQDSTPRTVAFSTTVRWPGGTAYTPSQANGAIDIVTLYYDGSTWYGQFGKGFA